MKMKQYRTTTKKDCEDLKNSLKDFNHITHMDIIKVVGGYALVYETTY
jgi:hypothetical protein